MMRTFAILVLSVIILAGPAASSILVVDGGGEGDFTKIQDAINASENGDEIVVQPGTYQENLIVGMSVYLKGEDNPVLEGGAIKNESLPSVPLIKVTADNVTIEGFSISNCTEDSCNFGTVVVASDGCKLLNNTISYCNGHGIYLSGGGDNHLISGNVVHNCKKAGIKIVGSEYNTIVGNEIFGQNTFGIAIADSKWNSLTRNRVHDNVRGGIGLRESSVS